MTKKEKEILEVMRETEKQLGKEVFEKIMIIGKNRIEEEKKKKVIQKGKLLY